MQTEMESLFKDLVVIDAASFVAGPGAATIFADFGARVIKVEAPAGDAYRLLRARQHRLRLDGAEKTRANLELEPQLVQAREVVLALWQEIFLASSDA